MNLNQSFAGEVSERDAQLWSIKSYSYTRDEIANHLGIPPQDLSDAQAQQAATSFSCNVEGDNRWAFNDCEEDMIADLCEEFSS